MTLGDIIFMSEPSFQYLIIKKLNSDIYFSCSTIFTVHGRHFMESLRYCVIQMGGIQVSSIISELSHKTITTFRSEQIWVHCELIHKPLTRKTIISIKKLPPHIFIFCKDTPERSVHFRKIRIRFVWYRNLEMKMAFWIIDTHCAGRPLRTKLMSRYIGPGQNDRFDVRI